MDTTLTIILGITIKAFIVLLIIIILESLK